ncbi:hypothetical protein GCM10023224_21710 [Streptomonospora halophila]|uniref:Uncharacterized protein n=1 Tax=Streptomonospora halophila TaxID=427369 RepID=A0ABP9GMJ4_9ACTN
MGDDIRRDEQWEAAVHLLEPILWNAPFVVIPLLGFIAVALAARGRRMLPAFGLALILIDGIGDMVLGVMTYQAAIIPIDVWPSLVRHALNLLLAAGFLLLLIGLVRRVGTASAPPPDPAWSAPPPAAAHGPVPPGHGGEHPGPGRHAYAGPSGPQAPADPSGHGPGGEPGPQGPLPWEHGPSAHQRPPGPPPQTNG